MHSHCEFDVGVIGTGVAGLAAARAFADRGLSVVLLERHRKFGQETSSRNSEVIHSGIYYPAQSLKTRWCIQGREMLYEFCQRHGVPFRKTGKYVVATSAEEQAYLEKLFTHAGEVGVPAEKQTGAQVQSAEPWVKAHSAVFFPESGIIDSHQFMERLLQLAEHAGAVTAYGHAVTHAEKVNGGQDGWTLTCELATERLMLRVARVFNAGGLDAAALSNQALGTSRYEHKFCRGRYMTAAAEAARAFQTLVYPVPPKDGLGIHVTVDMNGVCRFGPDVDWWPDATQTAGLYDCDWENLAPQFLQAIQRYSPAIQSRHLSGGFIGVRPKLFVDGKAHPDFLIESSDGWLHLLGYESPGITASLAAAQAVTELLD